MSAADPPLSTRIEPCSPQARYGKGYVLGGGRNHASVIRRALAAGKVDELVIWTAPVILEAGMRLFDGFDRDMDLEVVKADSSPSATHVRYTDRRRLREDLTAGGAVALAVATAATV